MYVCAGIAEWSPGNKESDFRETGASFKEESNYPQLIELLLKENNNELCSMELKGLEDTEEILDHFQFFKLNNQSEYYPHIMRSKADINRKVQQLDGQDTEDTVLVENQKGNKLLAEEQKNDRPILPLRQKLTKSQIYSSLQTGTKSSSLLRCGEPLKDTTLIELQTISKSKHRPQTANDPRFKKQQRKHENPCSTFISKPSSFNNKFHGKEPANGLFPRPHSEGQPKASQKSRPKTAYHLSPLTLHSTSVCVNLKSTERIVSRPVSKQPIYSSGTAWKDISRSPDPVLSQKHLMPDDSCS
nr:PREDICTED: uncharacterized protein LOC102359112 [Latimeria chalumnae]|eukprot:XP_005990075.1 PREDICTED: uncharacterized protein LOC102359112 [Latimeria chalumnae]